MTAISPEDAVRHLLTLLTDDTPRRLIALAGLPGSGKSTLAARLAEVVNAQAGAGTLMAVSMDGFHLTKAILRAMPDPDALFARRGAPWTFDVPALADRLRLLRAAAGQEAVPWPDFQHGIGDPVEGAFTVEPETRLVLVEGLYLLHNAGGWAEVSDLFDERWFLDTPMEISLERLAQRHMAAWGLTRADAERRIAANDRLNAEIVLATRTYADFNVSS